MLGRCASLLKVNGRLTPLNRRTFRRLTRSLLATAHGCRKENVNLPIKMWVDADALPNDIKDIIVRAARRLRVETVFVANKSVWVEDDPLISFVRVVGGFD